MIGTEEQKGAMAAKDTLGNPYHITSLFDFLEEQHDSRDFWALLNYGSDTIRAYKHLLSHMDRTVQDLELDAAERTPWDLTAGPQEDEL